MQKVSKKDKPKISIFVPTGSRAKSLERVLKSLEKQDYKNFEVIIVDYKSRDNTPEIIEKYKNKLNIKVIKQVEKGLSKAANMALKEAKGEIFVRTDDDVVMKNEWAGAIEESFARDRKVGGVTGPTIVPRKNLNSRDLFFYAQKFKNGSLLMKAIGSFYFNVFMEGKPYSVSQWYKCGAFSLGSNYPSCLKEPEQEVTNLEACNFAVKTKLLKKIGGYDQIYTGVGEYHEPDASLKIKNLGYKLIFNPRACLNHCPSQDGFFKDRPNSYGRMVNFIIFHARFLKVNNIDSFLRYSAYLVFLNCFYIYMAINKRQLIQLMAIPGTIAGLFRVIFDRSVTNYATRNKKD